MTSSQSTHGQLTYADLELLPSNGKRYEIIAGNLYVNASPTTHHQRVSRRLQHQLYVQIELAGHGEVYNAPMDVVLGEHDVVEKHELYERAGVPEYWVVDPDARSIDQFALGPQGYGLAQRATEAITFGGLACVRIDLRQVW